MFSIPTWLLVIPILGFLVLIHELGHFVTAKKFGIQVTEFGFGFPPKIYSIKKGETEYSINLIPLGGFVKMLGEEDPTDPRSFASQSGIKRSIVLVAGSFVNLILPGRSRTCGSSGCRRGRKKTKDVKKHVFSFFVSIFIHHFFLSIFHF